VTSARRAAALLAAVAVLVALAALALASAPRLGYDAMYHLVWGSDLAHGRVPQYDLFLAPTPHPLQVLAGVLLSLLGAGGDDAWHVLSLLALGALAAALVRIGSLLFSPWAGAVAAAVVVTREPVVELAHDGGADVPALALVAWAGALALARPRREVAVLVLLALAGLLRPEAWLLSFAYAAWLRTPRAAALALAAPLLWALSDLAVTGDPFWSVSHTHEGTEVLRRETGAAAAVRRLPHDLGFLLGLTTLLAALLGAAAALRARRRAAAGLLGAGALAGAGFLVLGAAGLSLQPRYLLVPAAVVALLAAAAFTPGAPRVLAAGAGVLLLAGLPAEARDLRDLGRSLRDDDAPALEGLIRGGAAPALRACGVVRVPTVRPVPFVAYWAGLRPDGVHAEPPAGPGALIGPTPASESEIGGGGEGHPPRVLVAPPPGSRPVAADAAWAITRAGC
jgi:hypothetical protein